MFCVYSFLVDNNAHAKYQIEGMETEVLSIHRRGMAQVAAVQIFHCPTNVPQSQPRGHTQGRGAVQSPCPSILGHCVKIAKKGAQTKAKNS